MWEEDGADDWGMETPRFCAADWGGDCDCRKPMAWWV
jgi:hypothetical protein